MGVIADKQIMQKILNKLDKFYPYLVLSIALAVSIIGKESFFLLTTTISGLLCVIMAAKGNIWTYPIGLYNTFSYAYIAYINGLFGEMALNLFFYVPTALIGWFMWRKKLNGNTVLMRAISNTKRALLFISCISATALLGYGLSLIPTQNTPYIDALTNVLSIFATLLMMCRFKEQWFLYISLNIFTVFMWSLRFANGSEEGLMMLMMWSLYLINSIYGAVKWHIGAGKNKKEAAL